MYLISINDLKHLLKRRWRALMVGATIGAFACSLYAFTRPLIYQAEASFREKAGANHDTSSMKRLILGKDSSGDAVQAISVLLSRELLGVVVDKLDLQGYIREKGAEPSFIDNIKMHFTATWAKVADWEIYEPPLAKNIVKVTDVNYELEKTTSLQIVFLNQETFRVKGHGEGRVNIPFVTEYFSFTLLPNSDEKLRKREFILSLIPREKMAKQLFNSVVVEEDEDDATLLQLSAIHPVRETAQEIVNTLMHAYQAYLYQDHDRQSKIQLTYLRKKQEDALQELATLLEKQADLNSQEIAESGFADAEKELEALYHARLEIEKKKQQMHFEKERLNSLLNAFNKKKELPLVTDEKENFKKLRELYLKRSALGVAVSEQSPNVERARQALKGLSQRLYELEQQVQQFKELIAQVNQGKAVQSPLQQHSQLLISEWVSTLKRHPEQKQAFLAYLKNMKQLFETEEHLLRERLKNNYCGEGGFKGLNLEMAEQLIVVYYQKQHELEAESKKNSFVMKQLKDPNFEITSLSATLLDPISQSIVGKAGAFSLQLHDDTTRSQREKERALDELATHRRFLSAHLEQVQKLQELQVVLLQEKLYDLSTLSLELAQQQISLLEKEVGLGLQKGLDDLAMREELIEGTIATLNEKMAKLPKKWVQDHLRKNQIHFTETLAREIVSQSEIKDMSHHLSIVLSAPIDYAYAKPLPYSKLPILLIFGAFVGVFFTYSFLVVQALNQGVEVTQENLKMMGCTVTDSLNHLASMIKKSHIPLIVGSKNCGGLAELFAFQGERVIVVSLNFGKKAAEGGISLISYLKNPQILPTVYSQTNFDFIEAGEATEFQAEFILSKRLKNLLETLKKEYDKVILDLNLSPLSTTSKIALELGEIAVVNVNNESLSALEIYTKKSSDEIYFFISTLNVN